MNKHLTKYLTHENPLLRNWAKSRINRTDQVYEVIEKNINYIPEEHQYVCGTVNINDKELKSLNRTVLYCEELYCYHNKLIQLPSLPVCKGLYCDYNKLTQLPELPVCKRLNCGDNQLIQLPDLPVCERLYCSNNQLTKLPDLPVCTHFYCSNNKLIELPDLPVCRILICSNNPGYPFKK